MAVFRYHIASCPCPSCRALQICCLHHDREEDINIYFGGEYVYSLVALKISYECLMNAFTLVRIIAQLTSNPDYACNNFTILIQENSDRSHQKKCMANIADAQPFSLIVDCLSK
jgi:hypothetical protein